MRVKLFAHRAVLSFCLVMMLLFSCALRVAVISTGNYYTVAKKQSRYSIEVAKLRGTIYDCNMVAITNSTTKTVAAISPTPRGIMAVNNIVDGITRDSVLETLKKDMPAVCTVNKDVSCEGVATTTVYNHTEDNMPACHIVGYTDNLGHGISGLELAYDYLLYSDSTVSAIFEANGKGEVLVGIEPFFENDLSIVHSGVVTTIDINVQKIVEKALSNLNSGCAIVAEANSGKIRAIASVPTFNVNDIESSLIKENSPMLNRALQTFNVGSVFKPCVAACAIENGYLTHTINCEGSTTIADRIFRCHKLDGHGFADMCTAISKSCNCFFYDIAIKMGGSSVYKYLSSLSLNNDIYIADNLYAKAGNIPSKKNLENAGALANLSIGQGSLLSSPIAILNLYTAIATDGCYYLPSVVEKTIKDGKENLYNIGNKTRVMNENTANVLREYLKTVVTDGTGVEALTSTIEVAGKTATAQTGRYYDDNSEITNSWFCGFFPASQPQYAVVVMSDGRASVSTASIFAQIADEIAEYYGINVKNDN